MTTELYLRIRDYLRNVIAGTEWEGHLYAVGGCCRDEIMHLPIKDLDMAVDLPDGGIRFANWLSSKRLTLHRPVTFPAYGTSMLRLKSFPDDEIELVQTRKEKYPDRTNRNPVTVFGSLEEDCLRRDLTINSLYYNISEQKFVDITGLGINDIHKKIIRTPCDPDITYDDDPLRILRCIRFASRFGWEIEKNTFEGMIRNNSRLQIITTERIRDELNKMLLCRFPKMALEMMRSTGVMKYVIPQLCDFFSSSDSSFPSRWDIALIAIEFLPDFLELRMAALLFFSNNVTAILKRLKYSNEFISTVDFLISNARKLSQYNSLSDAELRKLQYVCKTDTTFFTLYRLLEAMKKADENLFKFPADHLISRTKEMIKKGEDMFGYSLPVNGQDVMTILHIPPGPDVRKVLDLLMEEAFFSPLLSRDSFLAKIKA